MAGDHVFESYIRTTSEALWRTLTDGAITPQYYYGIPVESTWEVGAPYRYATPGGSLVGGELPTSQVSRAIIPLGTACKLTLTHRDLDAASPHAQAILGGWPVILSGLKTLLETGEPLVLSA